ncbi:MAG: glycosyltransferase family 4 protein [Chitinophagaceae bacterium]|nr:glycosyltransferase family 4 protein [Chitinophagaceae bacterium]
MKNASKKILIVGLFLSEKNRSIIMRTAADQLAELLQNNQVETITVSDQLGKVGRFTDTVGTIYSRRKEYDIAIVPLYGGIMSYVWEAVSTTLLKWLGKKVILIIHGGSIPERMKQSPGKYLKSFKRADVIVCPSAFIQTVLKDYGVKNILIENVVQLKEYSFQHKTSFRPALFWMRTLEDIYNPQMAIRVAGILAKKYPDFKMVMAGYDRGMLQGLKELAARLDVLDKIEFPGYITQQQKAQYAATLDIYVCTNLIDNAPVTFIEMMAMGLPVISTNVGGIPFLVKDGINGLLVSPNDDEAMAAAIDSIVQNNQKGIQLAKNGLEFSKQFDAEPVMKKWLKVFDELSA